MKKHPVYRHVDSEAYQLCLKRARQYRRQQTIVAWAVTIGAGGALLTIICQLGQLVPGGL